MVTIDNYESYDFTNKTSLTINGLGGSDVINMNNPSTPSGLVGPIVVTGGDPTASDTLIVNAQPGVFDPMVVEPTATGAGTVVYFFGNLPNVAFTGIEHLTLVGQLPDGDAFGVDGTIGNDQLIYTPGATPDTGTVTGTMDQNNATGNGPFPLVPVTFTGMAQASLLRYNTFGQVGGTDSFVFNGTTGSDSVGVVAGFSSGLFIGDTVNGQLYANLEVENIASAFIQGNGGNDTFSVAPITVPLTINADATFNLTGDGTPAIVNMNGSTTTVTGGGLGNLVLTGNDDIVNLNNGAGAITVIGTAGPDDFSFTPTGATTATISVSGSETVLNTTNSGTLTIDPLGGANSVTVHVSAGTNTIHAVSGTPPTVQVNLDQTLTLVPADTQALIVLGGVGADTLDVNSALGAYPIPITFDGGGGGDSLNLRATGNLATTDTYTAGPNPGSGTSVITFPGPVTQTVSFTNLAPVFDFVPATNFIVNGNSAANAINYAEGFFPAGVLNPTWGGVTVDNQEAVNFINKVDLTINGMAGSDTININNPFTPTDLTSPITVNGGDPTASDTLIVNAQPGVFDPMVVEPTATGAGTVVYFFGNLPNVAFTGTEHLTLVGQLPDGDPFGVDGTIGNDQLIYTPGATPDTGTVTGTMDQNNATGNGPFPLVPVSFTGMAQASLLMYNAFAQVGGTDSFVFNGTTGSDDVRVTSDSTGTGLAITDTVNGQLFANIDAANLASAFVNGNGGNDTFTVDATALGPLPVPVTINADATFNLMGDGTGAFVFLDGPRTTVIGAGLGGPGGTPLFLTGSDDIVNLNNGAGDISVIASAPTNNFTVTPTDASAATIQVDTSETVLHTFNLDPGALVITSGTRNTVTVNGTPGDDTFNVSGLAVQVVGLKTILLNTPFLGALDVAGLAGNDTFNVTPLAIVPISVDGGDPIGSIPPLPPPNGDTLNVIAGGQPIVFSQGPTVDSGGVVVNADQPVSFIHIEHLQGIGPSSATINGTSEDDQISVIALDAANEAQFGVVGADGVRTSRSRSAIS